MPEPRPADPSIIERQVAIEAFRLAPDGATVVYVKRVVVRGAYRSHLWSVSYRGGGARQLTRGVFRDTSPAVAPDGRSVAFLRASASDDAEETDGQVWILPLGGGEAWRLLRVPHGVSELAWSPDGRRLAFTAPADELRFIVGKAAEGPKGPDGPKAREPIARRITRLDFRDDEVGMRDRRTHLFVVPVRAGAKRRQLTSGDWDVAQPAWSPDGQRIAFTADQEPESDLYPRTRIWVVPAAGGTVRELAALAGDAEHPAWSPDGSQIAFLGIDVADPPDEEQPLVWVAPAGERRRGTPRALTADLDKPAGTPAWLDIVLAEDVPGPVWTDDETLLVILGDRGRNVPYRLTLDGEAAPLAREDRIVAAGIAHAAGRIVVSAGLDGRAAELYAIEDGALRRITRDGSAWQTRIRLPVVEELELPGPGGPIQTWLASPPDAGRRKLPLIVHFHGGPTGAAAAGASLDDIILTGAGYRVARPNIRGSATFGADWIRQLDGRWGEVDEADALAVVDGLVARGIVDERRIGILGLSYGGFMVQWLIGRTNRFAAAVAENGVANQASAWANSFFGVHYNRRARLGDPLSPEGMQQLWRTSPLSNVAAIRTPLLMLQSGADAICPPADNDQLFTALRTLGREVEYVLYPEEHHEMKNYGRPDRRIDRSRRILDWFATHFRARK